MGLLGLAFGCGSTGPNAPRCGDATIQAPERCDDGNRIDGDGCNTDCRRSGQTQWCHQARFTAQQSVAVTASLAVPAGVVVSGERSADVDHPRAWLLALDHAGEVIWIRDELELGSHRFELRGLAFRPDAATVIALGSWIAGPDGRGEAWLGEFDLGDGELLRQRRLSDASSSLHPFAITQGPASLTIAGSAGANAWVARYDADWAPIWERRFTHAEGPDRALRAIALEGGRTAVVGNATGDVADPVDGDRSTVVFVRVFDQDGELELTVTPAGPTASTHALADALVWNDTLLVGESRGAVFPPSGLWSINPGGQVTTVWDPLDPERFVEALAARPSAVFVAGSKDRPSGPVARWLGRLTPDLRRYAWEQVGPPGQISTIATALDEPAIYAAVTIARSEGGSDVAICKYSE